VQTHLQEHRVAKLDGILDLPREVGHLQVQDLEAILHLHVLDPLVGLALRVDHERPAAAARGHDAVLSGERVRRQAHDVPIANVRGVRKEVAERKALRRRNLEPHDHRQPDVCRQL
jgi:hypothetical protein